MQVLTNAMQVNDVMRRQSNQRTHCGSVSLLGCVRERRHLTSGLLATHQRDGGSVAAACCLSSRAVSTGSVTDQSRPSSRQPGVVTPVLEGHAAAALAPTWRMGRIVFRSEPLMAYILLQQQSCGHAAQAGLVPRC